MAQNPRFAASLSKIDDLQSERVKLLQEYSPKSDEVAAVDNSIQEEKKHLSAIAEMIVAKQSHTLNPVREKLLVDYAEGIADHSALSAKIAALQREITARLQRAKTLPRLEKNLTRLIQDAELKKATYEMLVDKFHTLQISEQLTLANSQFVSKARVTKRPVKPRKAINAALFLLLGMLCSAGIVFMVEYLDDRIHDQEYAEKLTGLVTLTSIPELAAEDPKLIAQSERHSPFLESFRILRNNIGFAGIDRSLKLLAVTSPGPGEGKSTTCANLAIAMAMDGKRVVIMDCDFHRPSMHTLLQVPREVGFTSVLTGKATLEQAVVATEFDDVFLLPTGPLPPSASELLNLKQSRNLFQRLADEYDLVIIDCPPCTVLSDVQVISTVVDKMVIVVAADRTLKTGLRVTIGALAQVQAPLLGMVLNRIDISGRRYGYYYNYYYSYYNNAEGEDVMAGKERHRHRKRSRSKPDESK